MEKILNTFLQYLLIHIYQCSYRFRRGNSRNSCTGRKGEKFKETKITRALYSVHAPFDKSGRHNKNGLETEEIKGHA